MVDKRNRTYLPKVVIEELEYIKRDNATDDNGFALIKMAEHAKVGREIEKIAKLSWKDLLRRK
jgi:hypothetical protein